MSSVHRIQIIKRLEENGIPFVEVPLQNGVTILISQLGGRTYGPFLGPESESLFWLPSVFTDKRDFASHVETEWNLGGERFWIGPEIQYMVKDRKDYFGTISVPRAIDPGNWHLEDVGAGRWRLYQDLTLEAYNLASGFKDLHVEIICTSAANPLRHLGWQAELMAGVTYAGYEQTVSLSESTRDEILSAVWNLVMLNPGGALYIPCTPAAKATCYKGDLDERVLESRPHHARLKITGDQMYKAGFKAAHTFGRMGYLNPGNGSQAYLLVRSFSTHPSSEYPEEPPHMPGVRGDVIHVYNDDGGFGDMGEMECNCQTIGGDTGRSEITDTLALYLFAGPLERLQAILYEMLGVEN